MTGSIDKLLSSLGGKKFTRNIVFDCHQRVKETLSTVSYFSYYLHRNPSYSSVWEFRDGYFENLRLKERECVCSS